MKTIILNIQESIKLDYERNWRDLVSYEDYLNILAQREIYTSNQKGFETSK